MRELSSLVLVVARIGRPALSRVPRASMASVGGQPTLCLRRFLQVEAWVRAAAQPTPVHTHRRAVDVVTRPVLGATEDLASFSFSTQQPPARARAASGLGGHYLLRKENSLESNTKSTTVLAALTAVRPLAVALAAMSPAFTWMWNSCLGWGIYICICLGYK